MDERGVELTYEGTAIRIVAEGLVDQFHEDGGINYVEWTMHRADEEWFVLTMRRRGAKSPGQVADERLTEIERLKGEIGLMRELTP